MPILHQEFVQFDAIHPTLIEISYFATVFSRLSSCPLQSSSLLLFSRQVNIFECPKYCIYILRCYPFDRHIFDNNNS